WKNAGAFLNLKEYKYLQAWTQKIAQRPAVQRGLTVEHKTIK
ncbi:glutathione-dependent disulfide-bond oxidoreductase, partial [Streptococcus pyogenes]